MKNLFALLLLTISLIGHSQTSVPTGTQVSFVLNKEILASKAKVGDVAEFTVSQDVYVKGKVVIPAKSKVKAAVIEVAKGGRHQGEGRLKVQIYEVTASDGSTVTMNDCFAFTMGDQGRREGTLLMQGIGKNCISK